MTKNFNLCTFILTPILLFYYSIFFIILKSELFTFNYLLIHEYKYISPLDVAFRQISTFLKDSVAVVYGLRGL